MRKPILAGAGLFAAAAIAMPVLAWSADETGPPQPPGAAAAPAPGGAWHHERHGGPWRRDMAGGWAHHRADESPQQRCERRLARRAAQVAYVTSLLNLTPEQRPLMDKLQAALRGAADKEHQLCASLKPREERASETVLDRMARRQQFLEARLAALQSAQPALQALYQSLTPAQKAIIDHPFHRR